MGKKYDYVVFCANDSFEYPIFYFSSQLQVARFFGVDRSTVALAIYNNYVLLGKYKIEQFVREAETNTYLQKYFDKLDNLLLERLEYKKYIERQNKVFDVKAFNKRLLSIKEGLFNAKGKDI